jgi:hypothetical protein
VVNVEIHQEGDQQDTEAEELKNLKFAVSFLNSGTGLICVTLLHSVPSSYDILSAS